MRNFCHSCTLTINFSEVWPRCEIFLQITVFAVRLRNVLNTSRRVVNKDNLTWWYVLKTSWRHLCKTSWRHLEDVLKTYGQDQYIGFDQDVLKKSSEDDFWRCKTKANIFVLIKMSWRRLKEVFWRRIRKISSRCFQDVFFKTNVCWVFTNQMQKAVEQILTSYLRLM